MFDRDTGGHREAVNQQDDRNREAGGDSPWLMYCSNRLGREIERGRIVVGRMGGHEVMIYRYAISAALYGTVLAVLDSV